MATADRTQALEMKNIYSSYEAWKGWDKPFTYTAEQGAYFAGECRDVSLADADVLEIGFGSGSFLAWAMERGARVAGTEINPAMLEAALKIDLKLLPADFETVTGEYSGGFDTIVAFDVFEHFTLDEIIIRLRAIEMMLRPRGHLLLRFPNGQSPFGLVPQYGDPTHKTVLSGDIFEQLTQSMEFDLVRYGPVFRITGGGLARGTVRRLRYIAQDAIGFLLNAIYANKIPLDPNVVLVLRKSAQRAS